MLRRVEGDNADRVIELPGHEIGDDGFEVCPLDFGFAVNSAHSAEAVYYEVDGLIRAVGHDPWRPAGAPHTRLLRNTPTFKHETGNCSCSRESIVRNILHLFASKRKTAQRRSYRERDRALPVVESVCPCGWRGARLSKELCRQVAHRRQGNSGQAHKEGHDLSGHPATTAAR